MMSLSYLNVSIVFNNLVILYTDMGKFENRRFSFNNLAEPEYT